MNVLKFAPLATLIIPPWFVWKSALQSLISMVTLTQQRVLFVFIIVLPTTIDTVLLGIACKIVQPLTTSKTLSPWLVSPRVLIIIMLIPMDRFVSLIAELAISLLWELMESVSMLVLTPSMLIQQLIGVCRFVPLGILERTMFVLQLVLMGLLIPSPRYASRIVQKATTPKHPSNNVGSRVNLSLLWILIEPVWVSALALMIPQWTCMLIPLPTNA